MIHLKLIFLCTLTLMIATSYSQQRVEDLIAAEKGFASYALANNTKDAFLNNIDSGAVHLDNKGNVVNGVEFWTKAEKRNGKLSWMPEYAEISSSGNFGYTTGPWYLYQTSIKDTPVARGHFITIWHLDNQSKWKFLLDLGISYKSTGKPKTSVPVATKVNKKPTINDPVDIMAIEHEFIKQYAENGLPAYKDYLSGDSRLNREGNVPAVGQEQQEKLLSSLPAGLSSSPLGSFVSSANDLAAVYGNTLLNGKRERYLRIWRKEKDKWRIALEVLHY
jgi:hypothetical protein